MARPTKDRAKKYKNIISMKLTDAEMELLTKVASRANVSRSEYLRNLLLNKKMTPKYEVIVDIEDIKKLTAEYGKIGSNLNQIARYFNTGGERSLVIQEEIRQCITDLYLLSKEVLRMAGDLNSNTKTHKK